MSVTSTKPRVSYREMRTRAQVLADERLKEQVLQGIEWLNATYGPEWVDWVNPASLNLSSCSACVLGQVGEHQGVGEFWDVLRKYDLSEERATQLGFYAWEDGEDDKWSDLTRAWRSVID